MVPIAPSGNPPASACLLFVQVVRQQEMLYDVDFRLQVMERHVARASGVRSDEETKKLNAKIAKLTQVLDGVNAEHAMLAAQVKKAEEDLSMPCAEPVHLWLAGLLHSCGFLFISRGLHVD